MCDELHNHKKDEVHISVEEGKIIIEPAQKRRGRVRIEDLIAEMPADYVVEELDWGEPVGKEILDPMVYQ